MNREVFTFSKKTNIYMYTYIVSVYIYIPVLQVPEFRGENQISHSTLKLGTKHRS